MPDNDNNVIYFNSQPNGQDGLGHGAGRAFRLRRHRRLALPDPLSAEFKFNVVKFRVASHDHGKIINFSLGSIRSCANH